MKEVSVVSISSIREERSLLCKRLSVEKVVSVEEVLVVADSPTLSSLSTMEEMETTDTSFMPE